MNKKKLAQIIRVCTRSVTLIGVIALLSLISILPSCLPTGSALITLNCTGIAKSSLTANAKVNHLVAGSISRRGFVYWEGNTALNVTVINITNPSFEEGNPPTGWSCSRGTYATSDVQKKLGLYSCALTMNANQTNAAVYQNIPNYKDYVGKTVCLGAWVYATQAHQARLFLDAGVQASAIYNSGAAGWEFLVTPPMTVQGNATQLQMLLFTYNTTATYIDGVALLGDAAFEDGDFSTGPYSLNITGLKSGTSYGIRAFVQNEAGVSYGNNVTCATLGAT
jgi:hypothetical protein